MSAITSDWVSTDTDAPITRPAGKVRVIRREEEFRVALESYMARYAADQQRRAAAAAPIGSASHHHALSTRGNPI